MVKTTNEIMECETKREGVNVFKYPSTMRMHLLGKTGYKGTSIKVHEIIYNEGKIWAGIGLDGKPAYVLCDNLRFMYYAPVQEAIERFNSDKTRPPTGIPIPKPHGTIYIIRRWTTPKKCATKSGGVAHYSKPTLTFLAEKFPLEKATTLNVNAIILCDEKYWVETIYSGRLVYTPIESMDSKALEKALEGEWFYMFRGERTTYSVSETTPKYTSGGVHKGIDFVYELGKPTMHEVDFPVYSCTYGEVVFAGFGGAGSGEVGHGNVVVIKTDDGHYLRYAHLKHTPLVKKYERITPFTKLGIVGNTGGDYGYHLHFEVRVGPSFNAHFYNPYFFFPNINLIHQTLKTAIPRPSSKIKYEHERGEIV